MVSNTNGKRNKLVTSEQRLTQIEKRLKELIVAGDTSQEYFELLDEQSRLNFELDGYVVDFDEKDKKTKDFKQSSASFSKRVTLSTEDLERELEELIDENPVQSKLDAVIPGLAYLSGRQPRDVWKLYESKRLELEREESLGEMTSELTQLLSIQSETLDLFDFLPGALAEPMIRLAKRMSVRPEVFLLSLLTGLSSCHKVGTYLVLEPEQKFYVPPNLFAGIVAESGQKKSPILKIFVYYPLDALEDEVWKRLKAEYGKELEAYRACPKEELADRYPGGEPTLEMPDYYFSDATVEGINRQFTRFPQQGLLYLRDELSGVFAFDKYRNGKGSERQDFLSFYDGTGPKELRADGFVSRSKRVQVSILGSIQPEKLRELMKDCSDPDGQWARFLFVVQPLEASSLRKGIRYDINQELVNPLYRKVDALPPTIYELESQAFEYYQEIYDKLEDKRVSEPEPGLRAVYSKQEGTIGRLALNLHVIYELLGRDTTTISPLVPKIRIYQAAKLSRFFVNQIRLLHSKAKNCNEDLAPHLAAILERSRQVGLVNGRHIRNYVRVFKNTESGEIRRHFRQLEELGYGTCKGSGMHLEFLANSPEDLKASTKSTKDL